MTIYRKRKFAVAYTALWMTFVLALFTDVVDGSAWVASTAAILGLYGAANAMVHWAKNGQSEPDEPDIKAVP